MGQVMNTGSRLFGKVKVEIEGIGSQVLDNVQGSTVVGCINVVGAALSGGPFQVTPEEWDVGYRASDNFILVRRK
ncbi:MAG: hypothetical protein M1383_01435 [Patescibacteria group bacterium]|nr:hypothetical protein [Patescibacteria group bacterium]